MTSKITRLIDPLTGFTRIEIYNGDDSSNKYSYFSEDTPDIILNNTNHFSMNLDNGIYNKTNSVNNNLS